MGKKGWKPGLEIGSLGQKKRASIEIQPVFKIQYPMKNHCKYRDQNHYSYNQLVVFFLTFFNCFAMN
jgi:hypothetical protein